MEYVNFFVDESGSMTLKFSEKHPYFVICILKIIESSKMKKIIKRFLKNHPEFFTINKLNKELKSSNLTLDQKKDLAHYLKRQGLFELFYITVDNRLIQQGLRHEGLYSNKARAFNYLLAKDFEHLSNFHKINEIFIDIKIDNRNIKNGAILSLCDYLNTYLCLDKGCYAKFNVNYFDSSKVIFIQVADFFSNLYYTSLFNSEVKEIINDYRNDNIIRDEFNFPLKN